MEGWLAWLAAPMEQPPLFGSFHILVAGTGVLAAAFLAWALRNIPERALLRILGGLAALAFPSDLLHLYRFWTWHGFLWHIVLVFLGLLAGLHRTAVPERSPRQFACALPVWGVSVILATVLNILLHGKGEINLFYISPYYRSGQPVISAVEKAWGLPAGIAVYLTAMVLGALLVYGMVGAWRSRYLRKLSG